MFQALHCSRLRIFICAISALATGLRGWSFWPRKEKMAMGEWASVVLAAERVRDLL